MCPFCIAMVTAGATSAGGLTVFTVKKWRKLKEDSSPKKHSNKRKNKPNN